jgi:hypothetical protein
LNSHPLEFLFRESRPSLRHGLESLALSLRRGLLSQTMAFLRKPLVFR